jgi:hypothetical protein
MGKKKEEMLGKRFEGYFFRSIPTCVDNAVAILEAMRE